MDRFRWRGRDLVLDLWPLVLGLVLMLPLLMRPGLPLARDLVFVSHQPWNDARLGLAGSAPRAVPLDAVVSVLTTVVPGGLLARVVLPLLLALAGWGAHRLVADLGRIPRLLAAGVAVWNPYTVERLALGQWALLAAYAALPWLLAAARRYRELGRTSDLAALVLWAGLASLTPTGGLLAVVAVLAATWGRARPVVVAGMLTVFLQATWVLPALTGPGGGASDPAGVDAFAARAEGPGGVWVALAGLGGAWDSRSMPPSRGTWWSLAVALVVLGVVVGAWWLVRRGVVPEPEPVSSLRSLAALGVVLAGLSTTEVGADLVRWLVTDVPGAGLLRDGQKFLAPFALLAAVSAAAVAEAALAWVGRWGPEARQSGALVAVALPLLLLPDATVATWRTVDPVVYPDDVVAVLDRLESVPPGAVVTLPWRSYRDFSWGNGEVSSDPAVRWLARDVVVSEDLRVGATTVRGDNPGSAAVGEALESGRPADTLGALGVGWVLVYRDDPDAATLDLGGLEEVEVTPLVGLYRVPGRPAGEPAPDGFRRALTLGVDVAVLGLLVAAAALRKGRRRVSASARTR